jgi:ubiquinone/menaquinone biosynthesis C-methylase UbiE
MNTSPQPETNWGSSYRLVAAEKWKAKSAAMGRPLTVALVEYARPQAGMQVLDIASGTGEPAISISERLSGNGQVSALDLSPDLLEIAKKRAKQRGLTNIDFHAGDAQALPFGDNSFDLATCRFGVMFFHDVSRALMELNRVLRPGARACFAAWGPFEQPYWQSMISVVLERVGGPLLPPGAQDPFRFASPGSLSAALRDAGFEHVEEATRRIEWFWPGEPEEVWEYSRSVSAPFRALLDRVAPEDWPTINREVIHRVRRFVRDGGVDFGADVVFASGQKAGS